MTVAELIAALQQLPPTLEVVTNQVSEIDGDTFPCEVQGAQVAWTDQHLASWADKLPWPARLPVVVVE